MPTLLAPRGVASCVLDHLLRRIEATPALEEPFSHVYLEEVFPADLYEEVLAHLPDPALYDHAGYRHKKTRAPDYTRSAFPLTREGLALLPAGHRELWEGIASALTAPEVKAALFRKLARDLAFRYGVPEARAGELPGYSRPTLYRETEGFEIAPHPDTRKKVVTMQLYLPADDGQAGLGTALYKRKLLGSPFGHWRRRFARVKQFAFLPNSGYAFVVNNTLRKKSWHGRETLPPDAGTRNTLHNVFYERAREDFGGYLA
jgi:hypothetical protein